MSSPNRHMLKALSKLQQSGQRTHRFFATKPLATSSIIMPRSQISSLCVLGAGQMGTGIAISAALHSNLKVRIYDSQQSQIAKALDYIVNYADKGVEKGKITSKQRDTLLNNIMPSGSIKDADKVDFVIEAVVENVDVKKSLFQKLVSEDVGLAQDVIIASNTSSIPISILAEGLPEKRRDKFVGMHFFNPVPIMEVVEIIPGKQTSADTISITQGLVRKMAKQAAMIQDLPGFISNRLLMAYLNEAIRSYELGIATKEDIDSVMKMGCKMPMGPLELADFIGLDTVLSILNVLHQGLSTDAANIHEKWKPAKILVDLVSQGKLGKKSGEGFYKH